MLDRKSPERSLDTLSAFVKDAEHDILSVITALQAHIDLLHDEQVRNHMSVDRFAILNRSIARLVTDAISLSSVSELAHAPQSKGKVILDLLMQEIAAETRSVFSKSQVSLSCTIAAGTSLIGDADSVKTMITVLLLTILRQCRLLETISIVGMADSDERVILSFNTGKESCKGMPSPWRLGELRLMPTSGEGIELSAVAAMAKLHHGQLSVSTPQNEPGEYWLTFSPDH